MRRLYCAILTLFALLLFSGCRALVGIHSIRYHTDQQIIQLANKYHVPKDKLYKLDEKAYFNFLKNELDSSQRKDLAQPLQIIYFDSVGEPKFHLINCYVGGFPILKWNRAGSFNQFPPEMNNLWSPKFSFSKEQLFTFVNPVLESDSSFPNTKESLVIFWNHFMGRNSKALIELINSYVKMLPADVDYYYVNTDNFYNEIQKEE